MPSTIRGSRNFTVALIVLAYYVTQSYVSLAQSSHFPQLRYWQVGAGYWLVFGLLLWNFKFIATQFVSLCAFGFVMSILLYHHATLDNALLALGHSGIALNMLLFVILPVMFFSLTFDPFALVKDLPAIGSGKAPSYLLLLLSSGEMFKARSAEILEHLLVRGLDLNKGSLRIRYSHIYLPPLLLASIQEAAYRHSYTAMLGCQSGRFPLRRKLRRVSDGQKVAMAVIVILAILRIVL